MAAAQSRPNFFVLLDLTPDHTWDQTLYEARLKERRNRWSLDAMRGAGSVKDKAKRNLDLFGEIERVMAETALREKEADDARLLLKETTRARLAKFEETRVDAQRKGFISETQVAEWVKIFADVLTEPTIRGRIEVEIRPAPPTISRPARLDTSKARAIRSKLEILNEQSLYTLLNHEQPKLATTEEYRQAANAMYSRLLSDRSIDALGTARKELAGEAMAIFASEEARKKYDVSLKYVPVDALLSRLDDACAADKSIAEEQIVWFVAEAGALGWSAEMAQAEVNELAALRKWRLPAPLTPARLSRTVRCVYCNRANADDRDTCEQCHEFLWILCPNCGSRMAAITQNCRNCGFELANRFSVERWLNECARMLGTIPDVRTSDVAGASDALADARRNWAPRNADTLTNRMDGLEARVKPLLQEQTVALTQATRHLHNLEFVAARQCLAGLSRYAPGWEENIQRCNQAIAAATELVGQAQSAEQRDATIQAARHAMKALAECADIAGAMDILRRLPLLPPREVKESHSEGVVKLRWQPSPSPHVQAYVVVRGERGPVVSVADGEQLHQQMALSYDDVQPPTGVPLHYAVFAVWEGQSSEAGVPESDRVFLTEEVRDVTCLTRSGRVTLSWTAPRNASRIVVRRATEVAPAGHEDGEPVATGSRGYLEDTGVSDGVTYGYRIFSVFEDRPNNEVWSKGVSETATPQALPEPPRLVARLHSSSFLYATVHLTWYEQVKGDVAILRCVGREPPAAGAQLTRAQLDNYGAVRMDTTEQPVPDVREEPEECFYVPAAAAYGSDEFLIGESLPFICVKEVEDLAIQVIAKQANLQWRWPDRCIGATIMASANGWPGAADARDRVNTIVIQRAPGQTHGQGQI
ncbi:MAG: hypothetical protein ACRDHE_18065, partial [Ktedonobacterales bacterium]